MHRFRVELSKTARRDGKRLGPSVWLGLLRQLKTLETAPFPTGKSTRIKKLAGFKIPTYRLRAGNYRAVYRIDPELVRILFVDDKHNIKSRLKGLR